MFTKRPIIDFTLFFVLIFGSFLLLNDRFGFVARETLNQSPLSKNFLANIDQAEVSPKLTERLFVSYKDIEVPFLSQAPFAVWDKLHKEACEEANVVMVYFWLKNINPSLEQAENEIQKVSQWGLEKFNSYDTSAKDTALMAKEVYSIDSTLLKNPTVEDIKSEIDKGNVVVMGMAGRLLENPHYKNPGPLYHMLLIKGYDDAGLITNDVGTKYGKDFHFSYQNILESAHDWNEVDQLPNISPVAIVFSK